MPLRLEPVAMEGSPCVSTSVSSGTSAQSELWLVVSANFVSDGLPLSLELFPSSVRFYVLEWR